MGWRPRTTLEDGLRRTVDYYRANREHYWAAPAGGSAQAFRLLAA